MSKLGWTVFAGVRKEEDAASLRDENSRLIPLLLDVTDAASIDSARTAVEDEVGVALDGLVNNAGVVVDGPLEYVPVDELRWQFEVNVVGLAATTQAFIPALRAKKGRIVNMGSVAGRVPALALAAPYCASKWAVEALTDALRLELKPWGVHVAVVEPGNITTPIWSKVESGIDKLPDEAKERYGKLIDLGRDIVDLSVRTGIPAEKVARVVAHALTARRPRYRYLVGVDAYLRTHVEGRLPHRVRDKIWMSAWKRGLPQFLKK